MDAQQSPLVNSWSYFGFEGEPEPGVDYSWLEVQQGLDFIGYEDTVRSCRLFFSSRKSNIFLVRTSPHSSTIWNFSDCTFAILSRTGSILLITRGPRNFHLSGVSASLIELLTRIRRLPPDALPDQLSFESRPLKIISSSASSDLPAESSPIDRHSQPSPVVVTGTDISEEITGIAQISEGALIVQCEGDSWSVDFDVIESVNSTEIGKIFVVIATSEGKRYEVGFEEKDRTEARRVKEKIERVLDAKRKAANS